MCHGVLCKYEFSVRICWIIVDYRITVTKFLAQSIKRKIRSRFAAEIWKILYHPLQLFEVTSRVKKKQVSEPTVTTVMHIIQSETFGETLGEMFAPESRQGSRRQSRIGLYTWLSARLSLKLVFFHAGCHRKLYRDGLSNKIINIPGPFNMVVYAFLLYIQLLKFVRVCNGAKWLIYYTHVHEWN